MPKLIKLRGLAVVALLLAGCSTLNVSKTPWVVQTDEAEARVRIGYWDGRWEYVSADWEAGERNALAQCRDWGFTKIERIGDTIDVCTKSHDDGYGGTVCTESDIYRDYRCLR